MNDALNNPVANAEIVFENDAGQLRKVEGRYWYLCPPEGTEISEDQMGQFLSVMSEAKPLLPLILDRRNSYSAAFAAYRLAQQCIHLSVSRLAYVAYNRIGTITAQFVLDAYVTGLRSVVVPSLKDAICWVES